MLLVPDEHWGILTVFQEAEGEPFDGKVAVAEVILRRTKQHYFSNGTVVATCLWPHQFSGWNTMSWNRIRSAQIDAEAPAMQECLAAWAEALTGTNFSKDALLYLNPRVVDHLPTWANPDRYVVTIGRHDFYIV